MERLDLISEHIKKALARHEIWPAAIQLTAYSDLSPSGEFQETWLAVTVDKLIILTGRSMDGKEPNRSRNASSARPNASIITPGISGDKSHTSEAWEETGYTAYELKDLEGICCENMVSSGILTAKLHGDTIVLCRFTNTHAQKFRKFAGLAGKLVEGKELTEEDFVDDRLPARCPKCGLLYPEGNRRICPKCLNKMSIMMKVLSYAPRYKLHIGLILVCMLLSSALNLAGPYLRGNVLFDQVISEGGKYHGRIGEVVILIVLVQLLALLVSIAYGRINAITSAKIIYDIKCDVFAAMQRLSLSFYSNKQTGELMTSVNNDTKQLHAFFLEGIPYSIVNLVNVIGISIVIFIVNWQLALFVFLPIPLVILTTKRLIPRLRRMFAKFIRKLGAVNSLVNDTLTGARVVRAFGKEASEVNRFAGTNQDMFAARIRLGMVANTVFPIIQFAVSFGGIIIWQVGGWQIVNGNITFGTLMSFVGYTQMIYGPLQFLTRLIDWWTFCMNSAERVFEIIDAVPEVVEVPDPVRLSNMEGSITLKNVTFSYEPNKPVLHDVSLEIKPGEMIGLVGHSGAGKSTIANIISRLYDVMEGSILIDGVDIKELSIRDLRLQIGMVLQETYIFMGTIAENIAYGNPTASLEDIITAAKMANAHDFIMKLPDGYNTRAGIGGHTFSGGEKQRISIARAILHNPKILILDEATSSVDTETEWQIQEALEKLVKGRTTISIAHRLSTLRNADRLIVMENGRIAESGSHSELIKMKGEYYKLVRKQSEALKLKGVGE